MLDVGCLSDGCGVDHAGSLPSGFVSTLNGRQVPTNAPGYPRRGVLNGFPRQVCIPRGRLHLRVTKQLPDHREALTQRQRPRSIRVAEIVYQRSTGAM